MPLCTLCDSQNFDVLDGLYFCIQCGTQSQDVHEEAAVYTENVDKRLHLKKKRKVKKSIDCGKPWFTLEGFQVIIKAQVEFLVQKGVNTKLKEIMEQMWFHYVQLSSDVFQKSRERERRIPETFEMQRERDENMMHLKGKGANDLLYSTVKTPKKRQEEDDMEGLELCSEIAREEFYEDDDPTRGLFDIDDEDDVNSDSDSSYIGSINYTIIKSVNSIGYMKLSHTLCFCYLSLLWLREPISLSDLMRWARDGHLPYFNATTFFPSHMKLSRTDVNTFSARVLPTKRRLCGCSSALNTYINLPDLPKQDIKLYIARYLIDLQLPACVQRCVHNVRKMSTMNFSKFGRLPLYDDVGMAFIVLTLKLIYGLDGKTEHELAKLVDEIPSSADNGSYFPAWSDLLEVICVCRSAPVCDGVPWTSDEFGVLKDCRNYSQFCRENVFGSWEPPLTVARQTKERPGGKGLTSAKQDEYMTMFEKFTVKKEDAGQGEMPVNLRDASSFPLLCGKREWMEADARREANMQHSGLDRDGSRSNETPPGRDVHAGSGLTANQRERNAPSVRPTKNPFEQVKRRGVSWEAITNYYLSENTDDECVAGTAAGDSSGLQNEEILSKRPRSCSMSSDSPPSECRARYVRYNFPTCFYSKDPKSEIYWSQCWKKAALPDSLRHLVELCSKVVDTEPNVLFTVVQELEKNLFA